jgi:hypothetical protein
MRSRVQHLRLRLLIALTRALTRVLALLGLRESVVRWRTARARSRRAAAEARGDFGRSRPALHGMDVKLDEIIDRDAGFFVEAGAYDGYTQSNTYWLERGRGWRGLLVATRRHRGAVRAGAPGERREQDPDALRRADVGCGEAQQ